MATKITGFPQSSNEYDKWIKAGKTFTGGSWYEPKTTLNVPTNSSSTILDLSKAPTTDNSSLISNIRTQMVGVQAQVAQKQKELDEAKKAGYAGSEQIQRDAQGNVIPKTITPETPTEPTIWEKLLGKQQETQNAITALPTADELVNKTFEKWGITPDTFQTMNTVSTQIGDINKQIADLDTAEMTALNNIELRPGISMEFMSGEQRRISREYSIKRAGLAGQASALGTQLTALQGNFTLAKSMASMTIDAALTSQKQYIDDLKWGDEFFADTIQAMEASDRDTWKTTLAYQQKAYDDQRADLEAIGDMVVNPATAKAFQGIDWTKLTLQEAQDIVGKWQASQPIEVKAPETAGDYYWDSATGTWKSIAGGGTQTDTRKYIQDPNNPNASVLNPNYGKSLGTEIPTIQTLSGKPLTDAQNLSFGYAQRMNDADIIISELGNKFTGAISYISGNKYFPNIAKSEDRQKYEQAERNFINAVLRKESGAAISPSEFDSAAKQYFPQPGDGKGVIEQKKKNRERAISNLAQSANVPLSQITGQNQSTNEEIKAGTIIEYNGKKYKVGINGDLTPQ